MPRPIAVILVGAVIGHATRSGEPGQRVWQSDVSVRTLEFSITKPAGSITTRVTVAADGDGARALHLEIMLPVGVGVLAMPEGCRSSPSPVMSLSARVTCALGDLRAHERRSVSIVTTDRPASRTPLRFAAFAFSDTPDPQPTNNFVERMVSTGGLSRGSVSRGSESGL